MKAIIMLIIAIMLATSFVVTAQDNGCPAGQLRVNGECADPSISALPTGWSKIEPGGETMCAYGTDYAYFVRPGNTDRLLVFFQGGGGCWNTETCRDDGREFNGFMDTAITARDHPANAAGVLDLDNPENPFGEDTVLYIPVCTGDVHWGSAYTEFEDGVAVHFNGFTNATTALQWAYENIQQPESVFVTGCSAGSMGSMFHVPYIIEQYPTAHLTQIGDSLSLLNTTAPGIDSIWQAFDNVPDWIPGLAEMDLSEWSTAQHYIEIANFYPDYTFGEVNSNADRVQVFYTFPEGEGDAAAWTAMLDRHLNTIWDSVPNYRSFTIGGNTHCLLPRDAFYDYEIDGVRLVDWIAALDRGEDVDILRHE
ncbi:MAG: pectinacetylesterase family protein [Chloroflexi bacterium]|nr:pectinacetylesterase family protein [Chloroflexota bacterium]